MLTKQNIEILIENYTEFCKLIEKTAKIVFGMRITKPIIDVESFEIIEDRVVATIEYREDGVGKSRYQTIDFPATYLTDSKEWRQAEKIYSQNYKAVRKDIGVF